MEEKKKLLILGGNEASCDIVIKAKEMGIYTIVTDWYDEIRSPAKKIADKAYMVSISDIEGMLEIIRKENVSGILTGFTDSYLPYYYEICKASGLNCYGNLEQFEICINKEKFKSVCRKNKVPVIPEYTLEEKEKIQYPVIVKPVDNSGSRGVFKCHNETELMQRYQEALKYSQSKKVIIERCVQAQHVNMYYTIIDGMPILSAMADRYVNFLDENVAPMPSCLIHPSSHLDEYMAKTDKYVKEMFKDLKMQNGVAFVQGFYEDGEFMIYEIGYRLNGGSTFFLIDKCSGYNQLEMLINYAVYGKMIPNEVAKKSTPNFNGKIGVNLVVSLGQGKIKKIKGLEKIKEMKQVTNVLQMHFEGNELISVGTVSQIFAYILIVTETIPELKSVIAEIKSNLSILDTNDNEMIINMFDENII